MAEPAGLAAAVSPSEIPLELGQSVGDPVAIPGVDLLLVLPQRAPEVLQRAQVVERMDLAGDEERQAAYARAADGVFGKQARPRMRLVEILDDRKRLR